MASRISRTPRIILMLLAAMYSVSLMSGGAFAVPTATTTVLTASPSPALVDQNVTLTATVTGSSPTGTVTFYKENGATLGNSTLNASGVATFTYAFSNEGNRSLTARYNGNASNTASTSAVVTLVVNPKATTATTLTANPNPAGETQDVLLTATVMGSVPTGTVTFKDGGNTLGTGTINASGIATLTESFSRSGTRSLTASYGGDVGNAASSSSIVNLVINSKATTTTTLVIAANPVLVGRLATLTATVTGNNPTGSITFKSGTTTLGTGNINTSGIASINISFGTAGDYSLTAVYGGDNENETSTSIVAPLTVNRVPSSTALTVSQNPVGVGTNVTLTATVTGDGRPTGEVTFKDGSTILGVGTIDTSSSFGIATLTVKFEVKGNHALTASYGGDNLTTASDSAVASLAVNGLSTSTIVNTSAVRLGQATTLRATVTATVPNGVTAIAPTGTVTFMEGAVTVGTATVATSGSAELSTSFTTVGDRSITARYDGDPRNEGSLSAAKVVTVNRALSRVALTATPNPVGADQNVTLTATVTSTAPAGSAPTGAVIFKEEIDSGPDIVLGMGTLDPSSGIAMFTGSFPRPLLTGSGSGSDYTITAFYEGDSNNAPSSPYGAENSSARISLDVDAVSSITISAGENPAVLGQSVTLTATVTGDRPTGTVTFRDGTTILGTVSRAGGGGIFTLTTQFQVLGDHSLTASYSGDDDNLASDSAVSVLTVTKRATTTTISPPLSVPLGVTTRLQAIVAVDLPGATAIAPTGTITFMDGAVVLGAAPVNASGHRGIATFSAVLTPVGDHSITARYDGDELTFGSLSAAQVATVNKALTSTGLSASLNAAGAGKTVTLTAAVTSTAPAGSKPTGTVTFREVNGDGSVTVFGTGTVNAVGNASFTSSLLSAGDHIFTADYAGDANNAVSASVEVYTNPDKAISSTALTVPNSIFAGQSVTLTATVTGSQPSGTVTFKDGATTLGVGAVNGSGVATLTVQFATKGDHVLSAKYGGDNGNSASNATAVGLWVAGLVTSTGVVSAPVRLGEVSTLTATVTVTVPAGATALAPTGTVTFTSGNVTLGTVAVTASGSTFSVASLATTFASAGSHYVTASYSGDARSANSASASWVTINKAVSSAVLTANPNPVAAGQTVTITATMTSAAPAGSQPRGGLVYFREVMPNGDEVALGTKVGSAAGTASITTSFSTQSVHRLIAEFSGDLNNEASTSVEMSLNVGKAVSSTAVTATPNPVGIGQSLVLQARVTGAAPGGIVQFKNGATPMGDPVTGVGGTFILITNIEALGSHTITAEYPGDANNTASVSAGAVVNVVPAKSQTTLSVSASPAVGTITTVTAIVTGYKPTGTVTFQWGTVARTASLVSGIATFSGVFLETGFHDFTASYSGDVNNAASASAVLSKAVFGQCSSE